MSSRLGLTPKSRNAGGTHAGTWQHLQQAAQPPGPHLAAPPAGAARGPCSAPAAPLLRQTGPRSGAGGRPAGPRPPPRLHSSRGRDRLPRQQAGTRHMARQGCRLQASGQAHVLPRQPCKHSCAVPATKPMRRTLLSPAAGAAGALAGAPIPRFSPASAAMYLVRSSQDTCVCVCVWWVKRVEGSGQAVRGGGA